MADKTSPVQQAPNGHADKQAEISEDITRIVSYLNDKRSSSNERASGLVQELTQRRDEVSGRMGLAEHNALASQLSDMVQSLPEPAPPSKPMPRPAGGNPILAERYHAFCHDLDVLLDTFRARIEGDKPVQH